MSGPKTSRYTLTAEQRRILAEQRKIERRKAAAAEIIRQTQQALRQMNGMFRDDMSVAAELSVRTGSDNGFGALIAELNTLISTAQPRFLNTAENDVTSIERAAEKTKKDLASARQLAEKNRRPWRAERKKAEGQSAGRTQQRLFRTPCRYQKESRIALRRPAEKHRAAPA